MIYDWEKENMGDITTGRFKSLKIDDLERDIKSLSYTVDMLCSRIDSLQSRCYQIEILQEDLRSLETHLEEVKEYLEKEMLVNFFWTLVNTIIILVLIFS